MLRLVYGPDFIPAQPKATPANGAGYYLVAESGKHIQVIGTQARCNMLGAYIANPGTFQGATSQADFDWLTATLAQLAALDAAPLTQAQIDALGVSISKGVKAGATADQVQTVVHTELGKLGLNLTLAK